VDPRALAEDPDVRAAADDTARDHASRDRAEARHLEERPYLDFAEDRLRLHRAQHPDERLLDLLGELVDHAVLADLDPLPLGQLPRLARGADVEADDHGVRRGGQVDVVLRDPADARVDDVDADLGMLDLRQLADDRLDRALDVALEDDVEVCDTAGLELLEERLERGAAARLARERLALQPLAALVR
jgi:hypothetical protein